jgi:hypothetical protein
MKLDLGIFVPRFVDFAGDIVFGVSSGHEHPRQHGDGARAARNTTVYGVGDNGPGKLQKTVLDDALRIGGTKLIHKTTKFLCAFRVAATVTDKQNCGFHRSIL